VRRDPARARRRVQGGLNRRILTASRTRQQERAAHLDGHLHAGVAAAYRYQVRFFHCALALYGDFLMCTSICQLHLLLPHHIFQAGWYPQRRHYHLGMTVQSQAPTTEVWALVCDSPGMVHELCS
jgi:hypothetical protein